MFRFLLVWMYGDTGFQKIWKKKDILRIGNSLLQLNSQKPKEIHRSIRKLIDIKFWKGTEFRSFLIYFGPVILKNFLPTHVYDHFLRLFCAVTICYSDVYKEYLHIAKKWFDEYIIGCMEIYGEHSLVSNIHNLTHIVEDVKRFGNLNTISAYPFENRLHFLKLRIKQPKLPLEQITRRIIELSTNYDELYGYESTETSIPHLKNKCVHNQIEVYKVLDIASDFTLSANRKADSWFLNKDSKIIQMAYATNSASGILIHGYDIIDTKDFFNQPVSSNKLNIFMSDGRVGSLNSYKISEISAKMLCLTYEQNFVFFPLLHTLKN